MNVPTNYVNLLDCKEMVGLFQATKCVDMPLEHTETQTPLMILSHRIVLFWLVQRNFAELPGPKIIPTRIPYKIYTSTNPFFRCSCA